MIRKSTEDESHHCHDENGLFTGCDNPKAVDAGGQTASPMEKPKRVMAGFKAGRIPHELEPEGFSTFNTVTSLGSKYPKISTGFRNFELTSNHVAHPMVVTGKKAADKQFMIDASLLHDLPEGCKTSKDAVVHEFGRFAYARLKDMGADLSKFDEKSFVQGVIALENGEKQPEIEKLLGAEDIPKPEVSTSKPAKDKKLKVKKPVEPVELHPQTEHAGFKTEFGKTHIDSYNMDAVNIALDKFAEHHPNYKHVITKVKTVPKFPKQAYARFNTDTKEIELDGRQWKRAGDTLGSLSCDVEAHFHPRGCNNQKFVIHHEIGHAIMHDWIDKGFLDDPSDAYVSNTIESFADSNISIKPAVTYDDALKFHQRRERDPHTAEVRARQDAAGEGFADIFAAWMSGKHDVHADVKKMQKLFEYVAEKVKA